MENVLREIKLPFEAVTPTQRPQQLNRLLSQAGEYLVCFDVSRRGYAIDLAGECRDYDAVADIKGRLCRIQIKSCMEPRGLWGKNRAVGYGYAGSGDSKTGKGSLQDYVGLIDVFAFVALDRRVIIYQAVRDVKTYGRRFHVAQMTQEASDLSWKHFIDVWEGQQVPGGFFGIPSPA